MYKKLWSKILRVGLDSFWDKEKWLTLGSDQDRNPFFGIGYVIMQCEYDALQYSILLGSEISAFVGGGLCSTEC